MVCRSFRIATGRGAPGQCSAHNQGVTRWWDGSRWTDHVQQQGQPGGFPGQAGGSTTASGSSPNGNAPWYKKKWVWALAAVVLIIGIGSAAGSSGGDGSHPAASGSSDNAHKKSAHKNQDEPAKEEPAPEWKTVATLSGNTNKAGPDFHLNGCDTRMTYNVQGDTSPLVAFYVQDSGTQLEKDGGIPVASPTESGRGETTLRRDEGDYYIQVVSANAEWQAQVQEQC